MSVRKIVESEIISKAVSEDLKRRFEDSDTAIELLRVEVSNGSVIRAIYKRHPQSYGAVDLEEYKEIVGVIDIEEE